MTHWEQEAIARIQQATGLTGGAFAILDKNGLRTECFGLADKETGRPITEDSMFDIASNSKAFTSMLGAIAASRGLLDWDAPVKRYVPDFDMTDPYAGERVTLRDFGCHRTGLARHEFMRARVYSSIEDMALRTRFMEMDRGFRESYRYNNQGFIVLGHVMERVLGKPWEQAIRDEIAAPLGMTVRFRGRDCDFSGLDCALPHRTDCKGGSYRCNYADNHVAGPCGGVRTNLKGMIAWLRCLLAEGAPLCAAEQFRELTYTNIPTDDGSGRELCCGYGLGWRTSAYRGRRLISHGGSIQGFNSHVAFCPDEGWGLVILMNTSSTWGAATLRDVLLDELCGADPRDITPEIEDWRQAMSGGSKTLEAAHTGKPLDNAAKAAFCGQFFHPAYDDFTVLEEKDAVWLHYGNFRAKVTLQPDGTALACEEDAVPDWMKLRPAAHGLDVMTSDLAMWLPFTRTK